MLTKWKLLRRRGPGQPRELVGLFDPFDAGVKASGLDRSLWVSLADGEWCAGEWWLRPVRVPDTDHDRVMLAIEVALEDGQTAGAHHKMWVIDQMLRVLAGDRYHGLITRYCAGEDGPNTYEWDEGIAP